MSRLGKLRVWGSRHGDSDVVIVSLDMGDGAQPPLARLDLADSLQHREHSPDGFSWGYGGSGPSQLAFAILLETKGLEFAETHYMDFKFATVANIPREWDAWKLVVDLDRWILEPEGEDVIEITQRLVDPVDSKITQEQQLSTETKLALGRLIVEIERRYVQGEPKSWVDGQMLTHAQSLFDLLPMTDLEVDRIFEEG